jgi:hypothetical protein
MSLCCGLLAEQECMQMQELIDEAGVKILQGMMMS